MRLHRFLGVAIVCAGVLVGCASGDDSATASTAAAVTTSTASSATSAAATTTTAKRPSATGGVHWTTYYGSNDRAGVATDGPAAANVRKQWTSPTLDGDVYAQPLLVRNRVITATENNTIYSLNAATGAIVWQRHLGASVPGSSLPCGNVDPVGITGTPAIDLTTNRIYAVGMVLPKQHMLFAVNLANGQIVGSTRVDVAGSDPGAQNQRSALTVANGVVYVPFGGRFGDCGEYHGRLVAVSVSRAGLGAMRSYTLPTENRGGWWAPPGAVTASDGTMYLATGNSSSNGAFDYGNSVVRLRPTPALLDYWAPANWKALNQTDGDIGTTSPVLLPNNRVFQVGKPGVGYVLNATKLGNIGGELHSGAVCSSSSAFGGVPHDGDTLFVPCGDAVVQVSVSGDSFSTGWRASLSTPGPPVIANGAVWTVETANGQLVALDRQTGKTITTQAIGAVPSRFVSPAVGGRRVVVAANRTVQAFGR